MSTNVPKYYSAEQYSKESGLGVEEVKRLCRIGEIPWKMTQGGYYKIPVYENAVPKEQYDQLNKKYIKAITILEQIGNTAKQII